MILPAKQIRKALITAKSFANKIDPAFDRVLRAYGGRSNESSKVWWHGSPSGDHRGSKNGLHLGTKAAAEDALNARIGFPAEGEWDGTREYGKTKLAGGHNLNARGLKYISGHNVHAPAHDYFPHEHPKGMPKFGDGTTVKPHHKPSIKPFKIVGPMTNTPSNPHDDFKANGYMTAALKRGTAKRGYFYTNQGEDDGSISAVVPGASHIAPVDDDVVAKADGGAVSDTPDDDGPVFYSGLQEGLAGAKQQTASPQDWKNILPKLGKKEEIDATGLHDFLDQHQRQVHRDELINHVKQNVPKLEETWKSNSDARRAELENIQRTRGLTVPERDELEGGARTKYHSYQTPGGTSYRELLLRLPQKKVPVSRKEALYASKWGQPVHAVHGGQTHTFDGSAADHDRLSAMPEDAEFYGHHKHKEFRTHHWAEPNILVHARMHDRKGPKGEKLLHIEELQSDWHQKGRERGYQGDKRHHYSVVHRATNQPVEGHDDLVTANMRARELGPSHRVTENLYPKEDDRVPAAPFRDTKEWTALAMKRLMRHAAKNGYHGITWTTGDQQAERYDLSKHIDEIHSEPMITKPGWKSVRVSLPKDGHGMDFLVDDTGKVGAVDGYGEGEEVAAGWRGKHIGDVLGKDIGKRITESDKRIRIADKDLRVGGDGMRKYYDEIVPSVVNKLAKEHGVKASMIDLPAQKKRNLEIRSRSGPLGDQLHTLLDHDEESDDHPGEPRVLDRSPVLGDIEERMRSEMGPSSMKFHYLPVTKSMKKPQKLFKRGGVVSPNIDRALQLAHKHTRSK